MPYGFNLEKRKNGVYYFRQTIFRNNKQISKRISLRTKDVRLAKFLAIQLKARIDMIDLNKIKPFEVLFDEENNIKSVKVENETDAIMLNNFLDRREVHRVEEHKREIEKLRLLKELEDQKNAKEKSAFLSSQHGQELHQLYEQLSKDLSKPKNQGKSLAKLKAEYIEESRVRKDTRYKYNNLIDKLIEFASKADINTANGIDRQFCYSYLLHMRKKEGKPDKTIKNIFNTYSTFFNHLIRIGEYKGENPFVGHRLEYEAEPRAPFTNEEINLIFSSKQLQSNEKLFFICLLMLTTGARPNEICQLWTDDIYIGTDGKYEIRITENEEREQSLKNKSSDRVIYLNDLLIKFGFIEYLKKRKKLGRIFDITKPAQKTWSVFVSKDITEDILEPLGIKGKTMYCFRHTVINRLSQSLVNREVRKDLAGHETRKNLGVQEIHKDLIGHDGKEVHDRYRQPHIVENMRIHTEEILQYKEIPFFANI